MLVIHSLGVELMSASRKIGISETLTKSCTDEKISGLLVNVFGLRMPQEEMPATDERINGMLVNIFGLKLPSEMVPSAYSMILKEHAMQPDQITKS